MGQLKIQLHRVRVKFANHVNLISRIKILLKIIYPKKDITNYSSAIKRLVIPLKIGLDLNRHPPKKMYK